MIGNDKRRTIEEGLSSLTMTDPAVFAGDAGALRGVLVNSSCFDFGAFFEVVFEAGTGAFGPVSFQ